ncbi:MAG: AAA family ATPase [Chloroflexota bacterium]|nr:AAA family ATPase [Chloroflexota bacterium]
MSGIVSIEPRVDPGRLNVLVGEGRTAEILRNLYLQLWELSSDHLLWRKVDSHIQDLFQIKLQAPEYNPVRGEIRMFYSDRHGIQLDISSAGRGLLQTMLLLAYMYRNPGAVLLLDEPDAHLEILRQRQIYKLLAEVALETGSQVIMATHSEVILETAFQRKDQIVAFIPRPRPIRKYSDFVKSLSLIPAEDYYLADQKRWVIYTEGTTDTDILRAFAVRLTHPAASVLDLAFHKDIEGDEPKLARDHFTGLLEAIPELLAIALFDRTNHDKLTGEGVPPQMQMIAWRQREIENYFARPVTLIAYAQQHHGDDGAATMQAVINDQVPPIALRDLENSYWREEKLSDLFLKRVLEDYARRMKLPIILRKGDFYQLVEFMPSDQIDPEISEKLDAIYAIAQRANPATE